MSYLLLCVCMIALVCCIQLLRTRQKRHLAVIPGPIIASFSNLWKIAAIYYEDMPGWNITAHKKYGPVVRIGLNHISFASPEAFQAIYNSRDLFSKSDFYEVGAPIYRDEPLENLFSLRDVSRHAMLRRNIGGLYTKASVAGFETKINDCVTLFMTQLADRTKAGSTKMDMSLWLHLLAFDCLGEINVSKNLGLLESGQDVNGFIEASDKIFYIVGLFTQAPVLQRLLSYLRSRVQAEESEPILKYTLSEVRSRTELLPPQTDMLGKLLDVHYKHPDKVSIRDVTAAIFINLTAGHDVLAITLRAIWYYLCCNKRVLGKLRDEIQLVSDNFPPSSVASFSEISKLPYLNAVIQETLRIHPNTGTVLERKAPPGGVTIDGYYIPGGVIVGVNAWVLHRDGIFGQDPDKFRPERWLEASKAERARMNQCLFSFGAGTHTCIGKNIAMMIISKVVVEFCRHFDATLASPPPKHKWKIHGSWVTKQTDMDMIITKL
ncbi:cytochrome P450 oxidoreductase [Ustulina deusta]|nr:cytochrome P450 oxidoreductase [Ustulina deusta]KAI3341804.1 cytochrome P450 oxidoreductase [Ustulina deusta]